MITPNEVHFRTKDDLLIAETWVHTQCSMGRDHVDFSRQILLNAINSCIYGDVIEKVQELRRAVLCNINAPSVSHYARSIDDAFQELLSILSWEGQNDDVVRRVQDDVGRRDMPSVHRGEPEEQVSRHGT